jgi:hypothetical protein
VRDEARFPDAGFAFDQRERSTAARQLAPRPIERSQFHDAPDEARRPGLRGWRGFGSYGRARSRR